MCELRKLWSQQIHCFEIFLWGWEKFFWNFWKWLNFWDYVCDEYLKEVEMSVKLSIFDEGCLFLFFRDFLRWVFLELDWF